VQEEIMALNLLDENKGCPIDRQRFTWKELAQPPISKLDDDAFTRVRIILMNGIEMEALRFSHGCARMNGELQLLLAQLRRVEQHQASMVNGLIGADHMNRLRSRLRPLSHKPSLMRTWLRYTGLACWRTSIIFTVIARCLTGWKARTRTT
jgi:hypothetical protein